MIKRIFLLLIAVLIIAGPSVANQQIGLMKQVEICIDGDCYVYKASIPEPPDERVRQFNDAIARTQIVIALTDQDQLLTKVESVLLLANLMADVAEENGIHVTR